MIKRITVRQLCQVMKCNLILGLLILTIAGALISLMVKASGVRPSQPLIWGMGTIWFLLFLRYGLGSVIVSREKKGSDQV